MKKNNNKMVWVDVGFWTNRISDKDGSVIPGHAWQGGLVRLRSNKLHGLKPTVAHFYSIVQVGAAIEKVLIKSGVTLHSSLVPKKYLAGGR